MVSLSSARQLAASCIQQVQVKYKKQYDRKARTSALRVGDWVMVHFPQEESARWRKLSRPWHGPYRIVKRMTQMSRVLESIVPRMDPSASTKQEFVPAQKDSQPVTTGMVVGGRGQEGHQSGLIACYSQGLPRTLQISQWQ